MWEYRENLGEPLVPTKAGKTTGVVVYDRLDDMQSMLFPVHKACLEILYRLCQTRQTQDETVKPGVPETIEAFCDALQQRRCKNLVDRNKSASNIVGYYYSRSGGIEWPHDY